ncbi:MAG: GLPGLI family protein [Cyclobacteriaceae bacterium]|nr:GLPGLI family protein [Cyclobacteriaceae bacterium]
MRVPFTIAAFTLLLTVFNARAQSVQGEIIYESKINMHRRLPPESEEMKKMLPEFSVSKEQLIFSANESLYKPIIEDDPETFDGGGVSIQMAKPYFENYLNSDTKQMISKREFMGKSFLIEDALIVRPWKFANETKTILGYECKQAYYTTEDTNQTITAWYTSALRPFLGPGTYGSLPGAILALDINNEDQVYVATKIELRELKKNEIKIPKGGEVTTEEGFQKMRDERIKQMGGHGGVVIRN